MFGELDYQLVTSFGDFVRLPEVLYVPGPTLDGSATRRLI